MAQGMWYYIMPIHIRNLGGTPEQVGLALSASGLAILLTFLPVGYLADRYSHRILLVGLALISVMPAFLLALANSWQQILVLLFFFYINWSGVPVTSSYLSLAFHPKDISRAYTVVHAGWMTGLVITPSIGSWLAVQMGMKAVFSASGFLMFLTIIPALMLKEQRSKDTATHLDYRPLLSNRSVLSIVPFFMFLILTMGTAQPLMPNYLEEVAGVSLLEIGRLGSVSSIGSVAITLLLGRFKGRWGLITAQFGMLIAVSLLFLQPQGLLLYLGMFLLGCQQAMFPLTGALLAKATPPRLSGLVFGIQGLLNGITGLISPALAGLLYGRVPSWPILFSIFTSPLMLVWVLRLRVDVTTRCDPLATTSDE
jgi:MFS family permease